MLDFFKNTFLYSNKYKTHSEAIIVSCFFNPQKSPYRTKAFKVFYESIKHLNHHIIECVIGDDKPELHDIVPSENRKTIYTKNLLWHKEALLNRAIAYLPEKYKYIFWIDADVIFTNQNWMPEAVEQLKQNSIVQLFEYCVHLEKDELEPDEKAAFWLHLPDEKRHPRIWRSFAANWVTDKSKAKSENYDTHGHVGFAWGATRTLLDSISLYDKALIGGADHIIAHAAVGQIGHSCIKKSFTEDIDEVNRWSRDFYHYSKGKLGYVKGDLYHIWHGDIEKRQYLKRIVDFTPKAKDIKTKDENGLYVTDDNDTLNYMKTYFLTREIFGDGIFDQFNPIQQLIIDQEIQYKDGQAPVYSQKDIDDANKAISEINHPSNWNKSIEDSTWNNYDTINNIDNNQNFS